MEKIHQQIKDTDIKSIISMMPSDCNIIPYDFQCAVYRLTGEAIRKYDGPFFINASVSAGKSLMIAMICLRFQQLNMKGMVLSRQAEIICQDADQMWEIGVKNSIFSAGAGMKKMAYPIICGTEKTVMNALYKQLSDFVPDFVCIDENHMVDFDDINSEKPEKQYSAILIELMKRCKNKNNRELRIIGYTGSPFRGIKPIVGDFWKKQICDISTDYLVDRGFVVPTIFGYPQNKYELTEFHSSSTDGTDDFSAAELAAMQKKILSQGTTTQKIMLEVIEIMKERNGALITCSGKRHCEEAAKCLPAGSYAIVTESTGNKERKRILEDAYHGRIKYLFQVGALTTGINLPLIDTSVILRKIMSLTLLVQLLGRGMRKLKKTHEDNGFYKVDHLVIDYTDTMHELGELYFNPILEKAELARAKKVGELIVCPKCSTENSEFARRCIGTDNKGERCEYFFKSRICEPHYQGDKLINNGCGALNDPCSRYCRICDNILIDPNEKLTNKHYQKCDYFDVNKFNIRITSNGEGLLFEYGINLEGRPYTAREVFWPNGENIASRNAWKIKGIFQHVKDPVAKSLILKERTAAGVLKHLNLFAAPIQITHRINSKNRDIVHRKIFA